MAAANDGVQSLKGMLRKPGKPVSIEEMNQAIAKQFDMDDWDRQIARDSELGGLISSRKKLSPTTKLGALRSFEAFHAWSAPAKLAYIALPRLRIMRFACMINTSILS